MMLTLITPPGGMYTYKQISKQGEQQRYCGYVFGTLSIITMLLAIKNVAETMKKAMKLPNVGAPWPFKMRPKIGGAMPLATPTARLA
jgi:hypothetical protein